jgi:hypothetical protein
LPPSRSDRARRLRVGTTRGGQHPEATLSRAST